MRCVPAFLSAFFALLLAGLPAAAQDLKLSSTPRELGTAVLRDLAIQGGKLRFRVDSNGCTDAGNFEVRVSAKARRCQLRIERVRIDERKAMVWDGVEIELDLRKDLGLKGACNVWVENPVLPHLLAATSRAIELELTAARQKLKTAEEGAGPQENAERFRRKIRDLEADRTRFGGLKSDDYPAPVVKPFAPASILESSDGSGPILPPEIREAVVQLDGPCAEGDLLPVEGTSKSGPFYHLAGIAGGDYGVLQPGRKLHLQLCLVYRREYFGLIGDYFVYVLSVR